MFDGFKHSLAGGKPMLSRTVSGFLGEGVIAQGLGALQHRYADLEIGSYPFFDDKRGPNTNIVVRARDAQALAAAKAAVEAMLARVKATL